MQRTRSPLLCCGLAAATALLVAACSRGGEQTALRKEARAMTIQVASPAFAEGEPIPSKYTCDGADISPPLEWSNLPGATQGLALICEDPDAPIGTWVHWVLYGMPPSVTQLPEHVPPSEVLENGAKHGISNFKRLGYGGPCPPHGTHRYFFRLYALDTDLGLQPGAKKKL